MRAGTAKQPLYLKLVQAIKQEIRNGRAPIGSLLPSEIELGRRHAVSRHTVREALRHLRVEGFVAPRKGAGTTVVNSGPTNPYVHEVASIEQLVEYATGTQYEVGTSKLVRADAKLAKRLGCVEGEEWMRIEGLRYAPGQDAPICWTEVYIHSDYANVLRMIGRHSGPIYAWIEDMHGVHINEIEQVLSARDVPTCAEQEARRQGGQHGDRGSPHLSPGHRQDRRDRVQPASGTPLSLCDDASPQSRRLMVFGSGT